MTIRKYAPVLWLLASAACADEGKSEPREPVCTSCGDCEEAQEITSNKHVIGPVDYESYPPAGGDHFACWAPWGAHDEPIVTERWVHNLEHGGVVFVYGCDPAEDDACEEARAFFEEFAREHVFGFSTPKDPDELMKTRFAAVSWGHRLETDCLDKDAFVAFYEAHVDNALESVSSDPPATCTGSEGSQ